MTHLYKVGIITRLSIHINVVVTQKANWFYEVDYTIYIKTHFSGTFKTAFILLIIQWLKQRNDILKTSGWNQDV